MKLMLQVTLGVFLGTVAAHLALDAWRSERDLRAAAAMEQQRLVREQTIQQQLARVRESASKFLNVNQRAEEPDSAGPGRRKSGNPSPPNAGDRKSNPATD